MNFEFFFQIHTHTSHVIYTYTDDDISEYRTSANTTYSVLICHLFCGQLIAKA